MSLEAEITALVAAANALRNEFAGKRDEINGALAAALGAVGAIWREIYVDPVAGNDANIGTAASPLQTLDKALDLANTTSVVVRIQLLGDVTLMRRHTVYCASLNIVGVRYQPGAINQYPPEPRVITYAAEAPVEWDGQRAIPAILFQGKNLRFSSVRINIPTPPAGVAHVTMIDMTNGGALLFENVAINADAGTSAVLAATWSPAQLIVGFLNSTIAAAAKGRILSGVAANADPNAQWSYRSNLTSL